MSDSIKLSLCKRTEIPDSIKANGKQGSINAMNDVIISYAAHNTLTTLIRAECSFILFYR